MVSWTLESKVAHLAATKLDFKNFSCRMKTAGGRELKCLPLSMVPSESWQSISCTALLGCVCMKARKQEKYSFTLQANEK